MPTLFASVCLIVGAPLASPLLGQNPVDIGRLLYEHPSSHWFEAPQSRVEIASDGRRALFRRSPAPELVSLQPGANANRVPADLDGFTRAMFCGARLVRYGQRGTAAGWYFENEDAPHSEGSLDPARDIETLDMELVLADLESVAGSVDRDQKAARTKDTVKSK